jgi:phospholipase/carboxylesterase
MTAQAAPSSPIMNGQRLPETVDVPAPGAARWSVIWLHGLGADGHDFEALVPELRLPADHGVRFVFPHAPRRAVTVNGGLTMRAWYDLYGFDRDAPEDEAGIAASMGLIDGLIERERAEHAVEPNRIVLAGFSQGGAMALYGGLRRTQPVAGILALSAYLPLGPRLDGELAAASRETPIFQAHGEHDPVVPLTLARRSRDRISALRAAPTWYTYPMEHALCAREIDDLRAWLVDTVGLSG